MARYRHGRQAEPSLHAQSRTIRFRTRCHALTFNRRSSSTQNEPIQLDHCRKAGACVAVKAGLLRLCNETAPCCGAA
jgi:hypothetical protein